MLTVQDKKHLLRFAKDNDIISNIRNLKEIKKGSFNKFFDLNFVWSSTNKGFLFWYQIHLNWHLYLLKNGYEVYLEHHCRSCSPEGHSMYELYCSKISNKDFTPIKIF